MSKTLYTLDVYLYDAPVAEDFAEANPVVCRTIEIRGDQTLGDFHDAIFEAFDRWEQQLYEFHLGREPRYRHAIRYLTPWTTPKVTDPQGGRKPRNSGMISSFPDDVAGRFGLTARTVPGAGRISAQAYRPMLQCLIAAALRPVAQASVERSDAEPAAVRDGHPPAGPHRPPRPGRNRPVI